VRIKPLVGFLLMSLALVGCGGGASTSMSSSQPPAVLAVSITAPVPGATVASSIAVSINLSAAVSVQLQVDGSSVGSSQTVTGNTAMITLDTSKLSNGSHTLTAVATSAEGQTLASAPVAINVNNPPPVTVAIASPAANSIVGGITQLQATVSSTVTTVQFQIDGSNVGVPVASPFSYSFDTTTLTNGNHTIVAVAESMSAGKVSSDPLSFEIINLGQWQMMICPNGTGAYPEDWMVESNFTQSGISFSSNSNNTVVMSSAAAPPTCVNSIGPSVPGTIIGDTSTNSFFTLSWTDPQRGPLEISGLCFDATHITVTSCEGSATGPFVGDHRIINGQKMAPFSGTVSGTLSFSNSQPMAVTATFVQSGNYTLSISYNDSIGPHTLSANVIGGIFQTSQGFDGNQNTGWQVCTGPLQDGFPICSTFEINIYDANLNFVGTLQ